MKLTLMIISMLIFFPLSGGFSADSESLLNGGIEAYNVKNNKTAKELLSQSLSLRKTGKGYYFLGNVLMNLGDYEHARFAYISALEDRYELNNTIFNLACASSLMNDVWSAKTFLDYNYFCGDRNLGRILKDPDLAKFREDRSADDIAADFKTYETKSLENVDNLISFVATENPSTNIRKLNVILKFMSSSLTLFKAEKFEKDKDLKSAISCYLEIYEMKYYPEKYLAKAALLQQTLKDYDSCMKTLISLYSVSRKIDPSMNTEFAPFRVSSSYKAYKKYLSSMKDGYHPKNAEEFKKAVIGKNFWQWQKSFTNLNPDSTSVLTNLYALSVGGDGGTGNYYIEKWELDENGLTISDLGMSIRNEEYSFLSALEKKKYVAFMHKNYPEVKPYILKNPKNKTFYPFSDIYINRVEEFYHATGDFFLQNCVVIGQGKRSIYLCQDIKTPSK